MAGSSLVCLDDEGFFGGSSLSNKAEFDTLTAILIFFSVFLKRPQLLGGKGEHFGL